VPAPAAGTLETPAAGPPRHVLVAEDNIVNQKVARLLLSQIGCKVEVAMGGMDAIEKAMALELDLILMDCLMPELDGYDATRAIRLLSDPIKSRVPIVGMTTGSRASNRDTCIAAGMDDHVSKPIDPDLLFDSVGRFYTPVAGPPAGGSAGPGALQPPQEDHSSSLVAVADLDTTDGLSRVGGNHKLYGKLLRQFIEEEGSAADRITDALAKGDIALAERLAHSLKGVAGNIGAKRLQSAAGALERSIRERAPANDVRLVTGQVAAALDALVTSLRAALAAIAPEAAAQATTAAPVDPARSREAAARLIGLLSESDPGAADFVEANGAVLGPLFSTEGWPAFEALVQGYAFAEAQARLEEALEAFTVS
jgi:two-component system sensor histidine kinase/response regulator